MGTMSLHTAYSIRVHWVCIDRGCFGLRREPYVSLTIGNDAVEDEICLHSFGIILSSFSCIVWPTRKNMKESLGCKIGFESVGLWALDENWKLVWVLGGPVSSPCPPCWSNERGSNWRHLPHILSLSNSSGPKKGTWDQAEVRKILNMVKGLGQAQKGSTGILKAQNRNEIMREGALEA